MNITSRARNARKSWLFLVVFAPLVAVAVDASAGKWAKSRVFEPGIACRTAPIANIGANWSNLGNWTGSTQTAWCPLWGNAGVLDLHVDVTSGWATTSACYVSFMSSPTNGFWYNPKSVDHQTAGYDTVSWTLTSTTETSDAQVQCNLPTGQMILDYNQESYVVFDETSW
jgi:hypothetical protein